MLMCHSNNKNSLNSTCSSCHGHFPTRTPLPRVKNKQKQEHTTNLTRGQLIVVTPCRSSALLFHDWGGSFWLRMMRVGWQGKGVVPSLLFDRFECPSEGVKPSNTRLVRSWGRNCFGAETRTRADASESERRALNINCWWEIKMNYWCWTLFFSPPHITSVSHYMSNKTTCLIDIFIASETSEDFIDLQRRFTGALARCKCVGFPQDMALFFL